MSGTTYPPPLTDLPSVDTIAGVPPLLNVAVAHTSAPATGWPAVSRTNPTTTPWDMTVSLVSVFCVSMLQAAMAQRPAMATECFRTSS